MKARPLLWLVIAAVVGAGKLPAAEGDLLGNQIKKRIPISASASRWALIKLPDDYESNPGKKYPLLIFCHGSGEANAGGGETAVSRLLKNGPPKFIAAGDKMEFTNPKDGKLYKFLVLSPQTDSGGSSFTPTQVKYMYDHEPLIKDRIDRNAIFLTGLSLGGRTSELPLEQKYESILHEFAALAPFSTWKDSSDAYTWQRGRQLKTPVWVFCGVNDSAKFKGPTQELADALNSVNPGQVRLTWYPGGHNNWNNHYTPTYREAFGGVNMNLYEWFLTKIQDGSAPPDPLPTPTPTPTPVPSPTPTPPPAAAGALVDFNAADVALANSSMNGFSSGAASLAFSETVARNPNAAAYDPAKPSAKFYGGARTSAASGVTAYAVQIPSSIWPANNWFWTQAGASGSGVAGAKLSMLVVWQKADFANGLQAGSVRLGNGSSLLKVRQRVGHSGPSNDLRLVFKKADAYYVSDILATVTGTSVRTTEVGDPAALVWHHYAPLANLEEIGGTVSVSNFENIQAAGILISSVAASTNPPRMEVGQVTIYGAPVEAAVSPRLMSAVSRKSHGPSGNLDVELPADGSGVEPRRGETSTLIFTFDKDVLSGLISVEQGNASLALPPSFSGKTMAVNLSQGAEAQRLTLKLSDVLASDATSYSGNVSFRILTGDVDGNGVVDTEDRVKVQQKLGKTASGTVVREDLNLSGGVSAADVMTVQEGLGRAVP